MKTTALLIPTYKRFDDLVNTLKNTPVDAGAKFIIVAHLEDDQLSFIKNQFGDKSIIVDEREYGKLGGAKAYNLAFKIAKENNFDYAILFADDVIPLKRDWLNKLHQEFIDKNEKFGIFSTDECHFGHFGWNFILDCPIAHFFIIDCNLVEQLFLDDYKQYIIDFELPVRLQQMGVDIKLLSIKLNHLRSGAHREFMDNNYGHDVDIFTIHYPKYEPSFKQLSGLFFLKDSGNSQFVSKTNIQTLPGWPKHKTKQSTTDRLKRVIKSAMKAVNLKKTS